MQARWKFGRRLASIVVLVLATCAAVARPVGAHSAIAHSACAHSAGAHLGDAPGSSTTERPTCCHDGERRDEVAARDAARDAALPALAPQGDPLKAPMKCLKCRDAGRRPCSEHPENECEWELDVLYCSEIAGCAVCFGVGWVDCKDCEDPVAEKWLADRKAKVASRKTALEYIDKAMKREVRKGESAHMVVVWEMEEMKVEKRRLSRHELLHLYLKRLETLFLDFQSRLQVTEKHFAGKPNIYVWYLPEDHNQCGLALCEQNAKGGVKLLGGSPRYTICGNKQNFKDDDALHRNIVHSTTHLLLSCVSQPGWMGNIKGGWMDEGLAHWFEDRYWGICDNYCYQEQNSNVDFKGGKFRLAVRKMVAEGKFPSAPEVFQQNVDTLTLPMHAVAMSYVDYLINQDGAKFYELSKKLKAKVPTGDALKEIYGMRPLEFEAVWKSFVLSTYPTR